MRLPLIVGVLALLIVAGVGVYAVDPISYLGDDPKTCNNCHVMDAAYESWYHSGHRLWTTCNGCHTPHSPILKYLFKGYSGTKDVLLFTLDRVPQAIRASSITRTIIQDNCVRCHAVTVAGVEDGHERGGRYCSSCHRDVPHGLRGISVVPYQDQSP